MLDKDIREAFGKSLLFGLLAGVILALSGRLQSPRCASSPRPRGRICGWTPPRTAARRDAAKPLHPLFNDFAMTLLALCLQWLFIKLDLLRLRQAQPSAVSFMPTVAFHQALPV
jgi:hypothetical protein